MDKNIHYQPKVTILMSTYNGEKYLKEQIDSLLEQDYENIKILIRDDGSTDETHNILNDYCRNHKDKITVIFGKNIGFIRSFFTLLEIAGDSDYYSFCDQDDYWLNNKISCAVEFIKSKIVNVEFETIPILYASNLTLVDREKNIIPRKSTKKIKPSFRNALLQSVMTGCTILINRSSRNILLKEIPSKIRSHDWWMYQTISAVGLAVYDTRSFIFYRQHGNNTIGSNLTAFDLWKRRLIRYFNNADHPYILEQARELYRIHATSMKNENYKLLEEFLSIEKGFLFRLNYFFRGKAKRVNLVESILFKILILFNKI